MGNVSALKLGLIGDNIAQSKAPLLHRFAGRQHGIDVVYDRLVPKELGQDFDTVFDACPNQGYRGLNITYPYKEKAAAKVSVEDPLVKAIGAVNTVLFDGNGARGFNTDYTGFIAAYRSSMGQTEPGVACVIGTGGVGRALAFGLIALGAKEVRLVDKDASKAKALAADLALVEGGSAVNVFEEVASATVGADGLLNGTPVGMVGYEGTPVPRELMSGAKWAFDAVYTPLETEFLNHASLMGLACITGYELFIHQGLDCWQRFSGLPVDEGRLRADLLGGSD